MGLKEEIHAQIVGALAGASFPLTTPEELLSAFPDGAETTCKYGDFELKAGDAGTVLTLMIFHLSQRKRLQML